MRNVSDSNWVIYKQARNYGTKLIRMAKRFYLLRTAADSRNFWKTISNCTGLGRKRHVQLPWPRLSPTICKITANAVNNFFLSTIDKIASTFALVCSSDAITPSEVLNDNTRSTACFSLRPVTSAYIIKAVGSLSSPATSTLDKISLHLLKLSLPASHAYSNDF